MKLEHVIARAMAELRLERGWTQADLAWRMSAMGLNWGPNRVTQLETLRRPVSLFEVAALSWVFEVPVTDLVPGEQDIEAPDGKTVVPLSHVRAALTGDASVQRKEREASERQKSYVDELRRIAKGLDVEPRMLEWLSRRLFDRSFVDEREARIGDVSGMGKQSIRTKRGHATRAMTSEIRRHLESEGAEKLHQEYRRFQRKKHEEVVARVRSLQELGPDE